MQHVISTQPLAGDRVQCLRAAGSLDVTAAGELEECAGELVERCDCDCVVVDLADVVALDAAVLGGLMRIAAIARRHARRLLIVRPRGEAEVLLRVSGVGRQLPMVDARPALDSRA
jgi:anti-anti-sigma factor